MNFMGILGRWRLACAVVAVLLLQGCTTLRGPDPADPLEPLNRKVTAFNDLADDLVLRPVAVIYGEYLPSVVKQGISNFFSNQTDVLSFFNSLAQLKLDAAMKNLARVGINTTIGIGGIIDWATEFKIDKQKEDFGQTMAYWGVSSGPYVVLPFFGPSTVRDSFGLLVDTKTDVTQQVADVSSRNVLTVLRLTDKRERFLSLSDAVKQASRILIQHLMIITDENITFDNKEDKKEDVVDEHVLQLRKVLKTPLEDLDLSVRAFNCLKAAKINSLSELVQYEQEDLMKFRNFGQKSLSEIEQVLTERGLSFGMDLNKLGLDNLDN
jgi:ABC-type transporter lipoprotein component MlaA